MPAAKSAPLPAEPFQISLHLRHPSLDPREISRELECEAQESFGAGEPRRSRSGIAATAVHCESYWAATLDERFWAAGPLAMGLRPRDARTEARQARIMNVNTALELLTTRLVWRHAQFLRRIQAEGGTLTLNVSVFEPGQGPIRLPPALCARLADLGVTLEFAL